MPQAKESILYRFIIMTHVSVSVEMYLVEEKVFKYTALWVTFRYHICTRLSRLDTGLIFIFDILYLNICFWEICLVPSNKGAVFVVMLSFQQLNRPMFIFVQFLPHAYVMTDISRFPLVFTNINTTRYSPKRATLLQGFLIRS